MGRAATTMASSPACLCDVCYFNAPPTHAWALLFAWLALLYVGALSSNVRQQKRTLKWMAVGACGCARLYSALCSI